MTKFRAVLIVSVTFDATTFENAELELDSAVNIREVYEKQGLNVERVSTDIFKVGPVKTESK